MLLGELSWWTHVAVLGLWAQQQATPLGRAAGEKGASKGRRQALCRGLALGHRSGPWSCAVHGLPGHMLRGFRRCWVMRRDIY